MSRKYVYTVNAWRFGNRENHSYIVGVYSRKEKALKAAEVEEEYRGGKYTCEVIEWIMDEGMEGALSEGMKIIKALPEFNPATIAKGESK